MNFSVLACCVLFLAIGNVAAEKLKVNVAPTDSARSVPQVDFYGESLCPYCRRYVVTVLKPLFDNGLAAGMDLTVYEAGLSAVITCGRIF